MNADRVPVGICADDRNDIGHAAVKIPGKRDRFCPTFSGAEFNTAAWFSKAQFSKEAWFHRTQFSGHAEFVEARFSQTVEFDEAQFLRKSFRDVSVGGVLFNLPPALVFTCRK